MLQRWLVVIIGLPLLLAALLLCPDWVTVIVVCGIAAAAAYELLHTAGKKVPKCVYAFTILAAVAQEWVIYDAHTWQFYDSYQSVGMIRILCVPLALVTVLFFVAVKDYGTPNAMPFADVKADSYYYDAVLWAVENGITKGTSDTTFSPDDTCTRAQIVTFLWRAFSK